MRAALTATDSWFEIDTLPDPAPGPGELIVRVAGCGICGSDLKARPMMPAGTVMGHELRGAPGGFAELARVSAGHAFRLPDALPASYAPLVEPFAVGRRDAAPRFGATAVVDPGHDGLGGPYDVVFECVGKPNLLDAAAGAAGLHGRIVIAGVCAEPDQYFPLVPLMKELSIRFSVYYLPDEFRAVVTAFADGVIDPAPLVTRTVGLGDLDAAFAALTTAPDDLEILVDPTA